MNFADFETAGGDQVSINPAHVMAVLAHGDEPPRAQVILIGGLSYQVKCNRSGALARLNAAAQ